MQIVSEDTEIARSSLAMMASYSALLFKAGKLKRMVCSMTSPVGALSCNPRPAPVCHEAPSTFSVKSSQSCLAPYLYEEYLLGNQPVSVPSTPGGA